MKQIKIIPCLDVKDGRVVKGVNFINLRDARDPVEAAAAYCREGADELAFLDIFATVESRRTRFEWVRRVCEVVTIPFAVGGGIGSSFVIGAVRRNWRCWRRPAKRNMRIFVGRSRR